MKLKYLTVPVQEEARVLSAGAWFDKDFGAYAITKYQNPADFEGLLNGQERDWNNISITMACHFLGLDRAATQQYLIRNGYLNDQKMPTDKGLQAGIQVKTRSYKGKEGSYCVYPDAFLDKVLWPHRDTLSGAEPQPGRKTMHLTCFYRPAPLGICQHYKKLLIPDSAVVLSASFTGSGNDSEVTALSAMRAGISNEKEGPGEADFQGVPGELPSPGVHAVLFEENFASEGGVSFASAYEGLLQILKGRTLVGYNLSFLKRLLLQTVKKYGLDSGPLLYHFSGAVDCIDVARTFISSSDYRLKILASMTGLPDPALSSPREYCQFILDLFDTLETKPFIPLGQTLSPSVPTWDSPLSEKILKALSEGGGTDSAVNKTGVPEDLVEKTYLAALKERKADPQWVMTLAREQELFTFIKEHPEWTGTRSSLKNLAGHSFTSFEIDTSLADWRFVKSLQRIGRDVKV